MVHKILVIGSGAREHTIIRSLHRSSQAKKLYCLASNVNPGISELCEELIVGNINDPEFVVSYAKKMDVTLAIIGPENPLESGVADALWNADVQTVGHKKDLAKL